MATLPKNDNTKNNFGNVRSTLKKGKTISAADSAKFQTISTMETALATFGYTDKQMNVMSKNDKNYALRKALGYV